MVDMRRVYVGASNDPGVTPVDVFGFLDPNVEHSLGPPEELTGTRFPTDSELLSPDKSCQLNRSMQHYLIC